MENVKEITLPDDWGEVENGKVILNKSIIKWNSEKDGVEVIADDYHFIVASMPTSISSNWNDAKYICEKWGGYLPTIEELENILGDTKPNALFITHSHFDHILRVDDYVSQYNIPVYISKYGIDRLGNENLNLSASIMGQILRVGNDANIIEINDGDNITVGDICINCIHTPGHSDCSITYVVGDSAIVGDVIFENAIGRYDLFDGDYGKLFNSIKKIKRLPVTRYFSGHGNPFKK